jgi:hypothetical protein
MLPTIFLNFMELLVPILLKEFLLAPPIQKNPPHIKGG